MKGNLSDQIVETSPAGEGAFRPHASTHPIHSPGKFTPDHPWWTSLEAELAKNCPVQRV